MVDTIKFSEMTDGGDISNDDKVPGLLGGNNVLFNNPWTFLAPGPTGDRPIPAVAMYYRLRFNTTLEIYEYYDPTIPLWVELSGSGTGTVNPGVANDLAYYAASGQALSPIAGAANSVLVTNGSEIPSLSTTLPSGLSIPGAIITASMAALLSGSVVAAPVSGTDLVNKTYADGLFAAGVQSLTGTTNQISFNSPTGNVTASLPQDIAPGSTPTFASIITNQLRGSNGLAVVDIVSVASAVNWLSLNNQSTGNAPGFVAEGSDSNVGIGLVTKGAGIFTYATTASSPAFVIRTGTGYQHVTNLIYSNTSATRNVTFQDASGTLAYLTDIPGGSPSALTRVDDTNVTLTLGGTPSTALLQAVSLTMGWTGQLGLTRGGTAASLTASNGGIVYSNASTLAILSGTATANLPLLSGSSTTPSWGAFALSLGGALTTAGAHTLSGAFGSTFTFTNTTSVTFPTSGTLATTSQLPSPAALTKTDDTNVTLTLGGTPATALLQATSITAGWTGTLAVSRGGTGISSFGTGVATALGQNVSGTGGIALSTSSTFTPVLSFGGASVGITYTTQQGTYTRTGDTVTFSIYMLLSNKGSSTGQALISGMPIAARTGVTFQCFEMVPGITWTGKPISVIGSAGTVLVLQIYSTAGAASNIDNTNFSNTSVLIITGSYLV